MYTNSFIKTLSPGLSFTLVNPAPVPQPQLLAWSDSAASLIQFAHSEETIQVLSGNQIFPGMQPFATRYGGHQFGHWAGQLGDGRAIILGEKDGQEIQLKGSGLTPYSRRGDGKAVLRSSLREYLCSEAMFHLGIPTTRALSLVLTGEDVIRDMFYDGHPAPEPGAITTRLAPTFIRFGHFQIHAASGDKEELQKLVDYTLSFYPGHTLESFFHELCIRTAKLMVDWLRVGFVHGVMNTDNMSILGLTIDYGPYGWLDVYDPEWTPNTTDAQNRRYRFSQQPSIALWNLHQLAASLNLLGGNFEKSLEDYRKVFFQEWERMMTSKLGLSVFNSELVHELESIMRIQEVDMTLFYRLLAGATKPDDLKESFYQEMKVETQEKLSSWLTRWKILSPDPELMNKVNPVFIPRNYLAQEAVDGILQTDLSKLKALELALKTPYELNEATKPYFKKRPEWARTKAGCSMLSCSS